ncbi:MAG TPA: biotin/lipoyl-containing protein, partial [Anaerolineales bacterium]
MADFKMPSLGADMDDGTLAAWKVKPGDHVKRGDIIADVETAKGVIEIEVFEDGVVDEILIQSGVNVPVGTVIARICSEAELAVPGLPKQVVVEAKAAAPEVKAAPASAVVAEAMAAAVEPPKAAEHARISPLARRIADDLHVDLTNVKGTGPGGAIIRSDIERCVQAMKVAPPPAPVPAPVPAKPVPAAPVQQAEVKTAAPAAEMPKPATEEKKPVDFQTGMRQAI